MTIHQKIARVRYALAALALGLIAAIWLSACSASNPMAPSATGAGSTFSTADDAPTGDARNSEPTDAPTGFTFVWQGQAQPHRNSFFVSWTPVVNVGKYEVSFERQEKQLDGREGWTVAPSLFVHSPTKLQGTLRDGIWRARVRSVFAGQQGRWSAYIVQSRETPDPDPVSVAECEWGEYQPGFWSLLKKWYAR